MVPYDRESDGKCNNVYESEFGRINVEEFRSIAGFKGRIQLLEKLVVGHTLGLKVRFAKANLVDRLLTDSVCSWKSSINPLQPEMHVRL